MADSTDPILAELASLAAVLRTDVSSITKLIDFTLVAELTLVTEHTPVAELTLVTELI